jgi:CRP-like cAMP-binding protein
MINIFKNLFIDKEFEEKVKFLKTIPIFDGLSNSSIGKLLTITYTKTYKPQELIFEEGKPGVALFIIKSGEVAIFKHGAMFGEKLITTLSEGNFFGEMALLEEKPRSASAKAVKETTLFLIYKVKFDTFIEKNPREGLKIVYNLAKILSNRLRETNEFVVQK